MYENQWRDDRHNEKSNRMTANTRNHVMIPATVWTAVVPAARAIGGRNYNALVNTEKNIVEFPTNVQIQLYQTALFFIFNWRLQLSYYKVWLMKQIKLKLFVTYRN